MKTKGKICKKSVITLISLVISIIVLLILSGITINMITGKNGTLITTNNAKEHVEEVQVKEMIERSALVALYKSANNIKYEYLKEELDSVLETEDYIITPNKDAHTWKIEVKGLEYKIKNTGKVSRVIESTNGTEPYLPSENFSVVDGTNLENGLVIKDFMDNEYVWIEVPNNRTNETGPDYTNVEGDMDYENIAIALQEYAITFRNGSKSQTCNWIDEWYAYTTNIKKIIHARTKELTDEQRMLKNGCGLTFYEYEELYHEMLSSVYTNGGFWIGRYEIGGKEATEQNITITTTDTSYTPVSKANQIPYTYITCSQSQELVSKMNSGNYTSSLMFGIQWDLIMKYLNEKGVSEERLIGEKPTTVGIGSAGWGNYSETPSFIQINNTLAKYNNLPESEAWQPVTETYEKSGKVLLTTGACESFCKQNIYDLAGNVFEYTLEHATSDESYPSASRGGYA